MTSAEAGGGSGDAGVTRGDMEREILGADPSLTVGDVTRRIGSSRELAQRLWRALGFPDPGDTAAFVEADLEALTNLSTLVESGALDFETTIKLTRAVGSTMARLADWQVATLSEHVEALVQSGQGTGSRLDTSLDVLREVQPPFEHLLLHVWRRQLAAAVSRVAELGAQDSDLHTVTVTVGFADLVSFTRLSNGIDEDHLAVLVEVFESACSDLITAHGGRVIKTLGDSVLFVAGEPKTGVDIAGDIVGRIGGDAAMPDVHVGLATGPVAMRLGDMFGPAVNLASRLTAIARRNRVICDEETAAALSEAKGYAVRALTERELRGFGVVTPFAIRRL